MNFPFFIAQRLISGNRSSLLKKPVMILAVSSIALGIAVMIIAVVIVTGFKKQISDKVAGFSAHIRIANFDSNNSFEGVPVSRSEDFYPVLKNDPSIKHIQVFATKAGIIKTESEMQGIVLKGISNDFDPSFFSDKMMEGKIFSVENARNDSVLISANLSKLLHLNLHDPVVVYFVQQPPRVRKFIVSGIYSTGLEEFDNMYVLCDLRQIQKLNDWSDDEVGGFEVMVKDFKKLDEVALEVYNATGFKFNAQTVKDIYPQIFNWLDLQNINVAVIISLMLIVAGINMISALLIIILENAMTTGILKSLGAANISIRKIFIYVAVFVTGTGLIAGNLIAITLCFLQWKYGFITLDVQSYYMNTVPVYFSASTILLLNLGTIIICILMLIIPSAIVANIKPAKVLRFD